MKAYSIRQFGALFAAALLSAATSHAADLTRYMAQPDSMMTIDGTSTIHDWTMETALIGGYLEVPSDANFAPDSTKLKPGETLEANVMVMIPVRSFKSGKNAMDEIMQEAMKEEKNPRITYRLKELKRKESDAKGALTFTAKGEVSVAGKTKEVELDVQIEPQGENGLKVSGTHELKMSDFDVTPPRPKIALGMIKTGDEVTLKWIWRVAKRG